MTSVSNTNGTSWSLTSLTTSQVNNITSSGAINTNIQFTNVSEMMNFILYSDPTNSASPSYFDNWEAMIVSIDTTTNGVFAINTAFVDPTGLRDYVSFKQIRNFVQQFWISNQTYVTSLELKFRLPKSYIAAGVSGINQNSIDPTGAYSDFNVAFYYGGGITIAAPSAVEVLPSPPAKPLQAWYQTINTMILNWRVQYNAKNASK